MSYTVVMETGGCTYLSAKVRCNTGPKILPDVGVPVDIIKCLILRVFLGHSPHRDIRNPLCARGIIHTVVKVFIARKLSVLAQLSADQKVQCHCDGFRHAIGGRSEANDTIGSGEVSY